MSSCHSDFPACSGRPPGDAHLTGDHDPAPGGEDGVDDVRGGPGVGEDAAQRRVPQSEPPVLDTRAGEVLRSQVHQACDQGKISL